MVMKEASTIVWDEVEFGDIVDCISERVEPSETDAEIYVGLEHLDPETLKIKRYGKPSDVIGTKLQVKSGDIIFGKRRAYQRKVAIADFDGICSAHAMVLRAKNGKVVKDFLPFFMRSDMFMERAIDISEGSLSPTIKWKVLEKQKFHLPPVEEQKRIAEILWAVEESIGKWLYTIEMAHKYKEILREYFCKYGIVNLNKIDKTKVKKTEFGEVPINWEIIKIGDILKDIKYGTSLKTNNYKEGVPIIGIPNIIKGKIIEIPISYVELNNYEIQQLRLIEEDILLVRSNGNRNYIARSAIFPNKDDIWVYASYLIRIRVDKSKILSKYLHILLQSERVRKQILRKTTSSVGNYNINSKNIQAIIISLPSLKEQEKIVNVLYKLEINIENLERYLNKLNTLKKIFLNNLILRKK